MGTAVLFIYEIDPGIVKIEFDIGFPRAVNTSIPLLCFGAKYVRESVSIAVHGTASESLSETAIN